MLKDVYRHASACEQERYLRELDDPELKVRELTAAALAYAEGNARSPVDFPPEPAGAAAGWKIDQWREWKGLPRVPGERATVPLYFEADALRGLNRHRDIVPQEGLDALFSRGELPENGIFLGRGWHELEQNETQLFRWLNTA